MDVAKYSSSRFREESLHSAATPMETPPSSSTMGDGTTSHPPAAGQLAGAAEDDDGSTKKNPGLPQSYYDVFARPDAASYFAELEDELYDDYIMKIAPKLRPIAADDSVKRFYKLCDTSGYYMGFRGLLHPEILCSMVSKNAIRCARAVLRGVAPEMRGFHVDPNARHRYGFAPLHMAAETFYVEMVQLLLRHGASANVRTQGTKVIEGLLPLNVAVENTSMHKYLEDNWEDGDPVENLIFLLCLPEMKMYLDTVRLIAKHTHNIVDELWDYIEKEKLVEASILLLAAQKQLRVQVNGSSGFDDVKSRTDGAAHTLHREGLAMVKEGKNGSALRKLKQKKEALLTADTLIGIVNQAGEALEEYIEKFQTHSEVPHEEILEKVSSILNSKGIVPYGKGIDTRKLECYKNRLLMWREKLFPQKDTGATSEADKPSSLKPEVSKRVNGLALNTARDKFFPYWKSVLSARMGVKLSSPCQLSNKDIKSAEASKPRTKGIKTTLRSGKDIESMKPISKDIQSAGLPWIASKFPGNPNLFGRHLLASNNEFKRQFCAAAAMSLKGLRRI